MTSFNWATWQPPIGPRFDKNSESNQNQIKFKSDFDLDHCAICRDTIGSRFDFFCRSVFEETSFVKVVVLINTSPWT